MSIETTISTKAKCKVCKRSLIRGERALRTYGTNECHIVCRECVREAHEALNEDLPMAGDCASIRS